MLCSSSDTARRPSRVASAGRWRALRRTVSLAVVTGLSAGLACAPAKPSARAPGVELGGMGVSWAAKNDEQKFGFMAAQVHPVIARVFQEYDTGYENFGCGDCHGDNMEQVDYAMPTPGLYALPKDNPYEDAFEFDEEISAFMLVKVTPALQQLFDLGEGPRHEATCFSCHPVAE